ncbi:MAG TPA: metallophosphoesterase family protein [candidate division Zixibacteria bacterium]|nr:metallophosphoesterase family protein [candidate division Zixibacteria bacterium]
MRLAVLSDIHANLAALEAVRADLARPGAPPVDETWVLGDIVGYGPQPNEVIRALQEMGARSVMGNHDGAAIGTVDVSWFNPDAARAIDWTAEVIDPNARAYLATLPEVRREGEITAVHGSPRDPVWEYITGPGVAAENLEAFDTRLCLHGHTHVPVVFSAEDGGMRIVPATPENPITISAGRALVNPGSVGQPRDGNPAASYLVLDTEAGAVEFRRVAYDIEATQRLMRQHGLPGRLVERLSYGR